MGSVASKLSVQEDLKGFMARKPKLNSDILDSDGNCTFFPLRRVGGKSLAWISTAIE